jgi:hypothetical protein
MSVNKQNIMYQDKDVEKDFLISVLIELVGKIQNTAILITKNHNTLEEKILIIFRTETSISIFLEKYVQIIQIFICNYART